MAIAVDRFPTAPAADNYKAARIFASSAPFTKKQMKKIEPDRDFICSEYAARCYEQVGLSIPWNPRGFVAPADFAGDPSFDLVAALKQK